MIVIGTFLAASAAVATAVAPRLREQPRFITPHVQFDSSVGVLGCKINTNRVAYWPSAIDCSEICVNVTQGNRNLLLLKVGTSMGAYDISYDAWNYLVFGKGAKEEPHQGGGFPMDYEFVPADECRHLLNDGKLAVSAPNGFGFVDSCATNSSNNWVSGNYELYNLDPLCKYGWDEKCSPNFESNTAYCPHTLGEQHQPTGHEVLNIQYGTGLEVRA